MRSRERAPWWKRRLGAWGRACVVLVLASLAVGVTVERSDVLLALQCVLLGAAAACYLVGLVRSAD